MKARSRGANQPATTGDSDVESIDAPPWADQFEEVGMRIVSYNLGMDQQMLQGKPWVKHGTKLAKLLKEFVHVSKAEVVCLSEMGGFRAGLNKTKIQMDSMLRQAVGQGNSIVRGSFCDVLQPS